MEWLERWDRRNQRVLERHERRYQAERAAGGGAGVGGAVLLTWGVGRAIGKGLHAIEPWPVAAGLGLVVLGVLFGLHVRAVRRRPEG